jgi:hypothetical protein
MTRTEDREIRAAHRRHWQMVAAASSGGLLILFLVLFNSTRISDLADQKHDAVSARSSATAVATAQASLARQGKALAHEADAKCRSSVSYRAQNSALCVRASELATATPSPVAGPQGAQGRGIATVKNVGGHLMVTLTDGSVIDAGQFVGSNGKPGRGIKAETVVNGHLVVSYSDGSIADIGQVVGAAGRDGVNGSNGVSVTGVSIDDSSHLIVTFSDGHTEDAGQLPAGPPGQNATGSPGPSGPSGPSGPQGDPGPACAPGFTPTQQTQLDGGSIQMCTSPPPS